MKFNKLIPELNVSNFEKSLKFYTKVLGFRLEYQREKPKFAFLSFEGSQIMIEELNERNYTTGKLEYPFGRGTHLQIQVNKINSILKSIKANKYPIFVKLHNKWYKKDNKLLGNKQFLVKDPDGYLLRFYEDLGTKSLESSSLSS